MTRRLLVDRGRRDEDVLTDADKTWTALFDNSKVKRVAGKFTCAEDLDIILAEPVRYLKKRLAGNNPEPHELDPLYDRICAEQSSLGT